MDYILTFLEGFASFISPCMLPMVPIYLSYFMGEKSKYNEIGNNDKNSKNNNDDKETENEIKKEIKIEKQKKQNNTLINSIGFVLGFTIIFLVLSIFASSLGNVLNNNIKYIKVIFGILIIILGCNYIGIFKIGFLNKTKKARLNNIDFNFLKAVIFGILFSISWTPCIGTFLSSALLLVAKTESIMQGLIMMLLYSLGLGIPFIISAVFIDKLKTTFDFMKKHFDIIKKISGIILIISGIYTIFF